MSAGPYHPVLRARLSRELARVLAEHSHTAIGEWIGHADTTPTRRGHDLDRWPLSELAEIARRDEGFDRALRTYVHGDQIPAGQAVRALTELYQVASGSGELIAAVVRAVEDQRISPAEAAGLRPMLRAMQELASQVDRDLEPIEQEGRA